MLKGFCYVKIMSSLMNLNTNYGRTKTKEKA
nr:MAG TPA: hypothetical protein [Bacteriophage sp.]